MKVLIKDTINNTEHTTPSITTASIYTYKSEFTGRSVSVKTVLKYLTQVPGWIFSKVT